MASNSFGTLFRITTWGESHGKAVGVVIDGCPAGLELSEGEVDAELERRAPGRSLFTSPRNEPDRCEILSGMFEGKTTGAPICIIIPNRDADSSKYEPIKDLLRPGHANYPYLEKYGCFDFRGGGRASARETVCRTAAGAVAKKFLAASGCKVAAKLVQVGDAVGDAMEAEVAAAMEEGDSRGGVVEFLIDPLPAGLGDPVYEKLEAKLGQAMLSLPASKGFEIGEGFRAAAMCGSKHNDAFVCEGGKTSMRTNHAGGTLGGISTGMPVIGRVAFKPASSIKKPQQTVDINGNPATFRLPEGSRHDPCVAMRAVPVVEAMAALVVADALLLNRSSRIQV